MAAPKSKTTPAAATARNCFAIVGSDEAAVKAAAKDLVARIAPPGDFGTDIVDGGAENADQAVTRVNQTIEALLTLPFFGGGKLVWLKSVNFLADTISGRAESVQEALVKLGDLLDAGLPADVKFVLSAVDPDKRRSFYKKLLKTAETQVFDKLDTNKSGWEEEAAAAAHDRAGARGLHFSAEAAEVFVALTGGDTRQIENEIEKLDLYLGQKRRNVTAEDVRLLVPLSRAGVIFELGNAIAQRDLPRSLALIDQLIYQGENVIGILLASVAPTVRNLLVVKELMQRHRLPRPQAPFHFTSTLNRLPESATRHLPRKKDGGISAYPLGIAACNAHRFRTAELLDGMEACLQANIQCVTTGLDPKLILSELVAKLAAPQK